MHACIRNSNIHSFIHSLVRQHSEVVGSHCAWRLGESGCYAVERAVEVVQRGEQGVLRGFELQLTVDQIN